LFGKSNADGRKFFSTRAGDELAHLSHKEPLERSAAFWACAADASVIWPTAIQNVGKLRSTRLPWGTPEPFYAGEAITLSLL
jgi:hypothetical protein